MPTTIPRPRDTRRRARPALAGRLLESLCRAAFAFPLLLVALLGVGLAGPSRAEETAPVADACQAQSLLPDLVASGTYAEMEALAAGVPNGEGKLFRIEKPGLLPSFLFGTMHMTDPRVLRLQPEAQSAFAASRRLVIESVDLLDEAKAYGAMLARPDLLNLPAGKTLRDYLTPAQRRRVEAKLAESGIPFQSVETLQPWFSSTALMIPACEAERAASGAKPLDMQLANDAAAAGKPVLGLESAAEQLEALASVSMDVQIATLVATLELKDRMPAIFETMTGLYLEGRIALLSPLSAAVMPLPAATARGYAEFEARIVTRRNHLMAERLRPLLAEGDTFVAIGALHLPGREGLVELLKAEGFAVTRAD